MYIQSYSSLLLNHAISLCTQHIIWTPNEAAHRHGHSSELPKIINI